MSLLHRQQGTSHFWVAEKYSTSFEPGWLDASYWQQRDAIAGTAQGRGTTLFIAHTPALVLRRYQRGGLVAKLNRMHYLYNGLQRSRPFQELSLLQTLQQKQLPAPAPVAAGLYRCGLYYTAAILTERIAEATDLVSRLRQQSLGTSDWIETGRTIARFHQAGIYHSDLNANNIMLDAQHQVWVIDFDKCEQRPTGSWTSNNLSRLHRSLVKEKGKYPELHWQESDWQSLLEGYSGATSA